MCDKRGQRTENTAENRCAYHHLLQYGVGAQDVELSGVFLGVLGDPRGLACAGESHHHNDLHSTVSKANIRGGGGPTPRFTLQSSHMA